MFAHARRCRALLRGVILAAPLLFTTPSVATTWYVSTCGNDAWAGVSPICDGSGLGPKQTIHGALAVASDGDTINVFAGVYPGAIDTLGKAVHIVGVAGRDATFITGTSSTRCMVCNSGEGPDTIIEGFSMVAGSVIDSGGCLQVFGSSPTIIDCRFENGEAGLYGGGVALIGSESLIDGCLFVGNHAGQYGGGLALSLSDVTVDGCDFWANTAEGGGGMVNELSTVDIDNCDFNGNYATGDGSFSDIHGGGGIRNINSTVAIEDTNFNVNETDSSAGGGGMYSTDSTVGVSSCVFDGNAAGGGGGMRCDDSTTTIIASEFAQNDSVAGITPGGGALWLNGSGTTDCTVCTFAGNSAQFSGGGAVKSSGADATFDSCVFTGNWSDGLDPGGAILAMWSTTITLDECIFEANASGNHGGALALSSGADVTATECTFEANLAERGGGVSVRTSTMTMIDCALDDNSAIEEGGHVWVDDSDCTIAGSAFSNGFATESGGAIFADSSDLTMTVCTATNSTSSEGGVVYADGCDVLIDGSTFSFNTANDIGRGGVLLMESGTDLILTDSTLQNNSASYSGGAAWIAGNSSIEASNCTFESNDCAAHGGALVVLDSDMTIADCDFIGNEGRDGGAIDVGDDVVGHVTGSSFTSNNASAGGGGLRSFSSITVEECTFDSNYGGDEYLFYKGGGALELLGGEPSIHDCAFHGNSTASTGGAITVSLDARPVISECTFGTNIAIDGGAIHVDDEAEAYVYDSTFIANNAGRGGALGCAETGFLSIDRCTASGNTATEGGGVMGSDDGVIEVLNTVINGNTADFGGGGYADDDSTVLVLNSTVAYNTGTIDGGGLRSANGLDVHNSIVWNNAPEQIDGFATVSYSIVQGGHAGAGNMDVAPIFMDGDGNDDVAGTADDDFRLEYGSPAIDAGDNTQVPMAITEDHARSARFVDDPDAVDAGVGDARPQVDIGAFERTASCEGDLDGDGMVGTNDLILLLSNWNGPGADIDGDGVTDVDDLIIVLVNWGGCV